jgi:hypothetical protein
MAALGAFVVVGGGAAAIAFALFRFLGEKWLSAKFNERLEAYKHAQQQELERLKLRINTLMDRTTKLHQREFEVLPEAWSKLADAQAVVVSFTSALQSYPDLNSMSTPHLEDFIASCKLSEWQKTELRESKDKSKYYIDAIYWHKLSEARNTLSTYHVYLKKNGIFIPEPLKTKFSEMDDLLFHTLIEHDLNEKNERRPREGHWQSKLQKEGLGIMNSIETEVQGRLWSAHATDV